MRNPLKLLVPTPVSKPVEKVWLLEWLDPWEGGKGEVFKHRAFSTEKAAVLAGQDMLERRLAQRQEPVYYILRMKQALERTNSQGNHYCHGIFISPLELEHEEEGEG